MSILIDKLLKQSPGMPLKQCKDKKWYFAKPLNYSFKESLKDAIRVLRGKSFAVHFKEDEKTV